MRNYTDSTIEAVTRLQLQKEVLAVKAVDTDRSSEVPLEVFLDCVVPEYKPVLEAAIKRRDESPELPHAATIHIDLMNPASFKALVAILNANGRNRLRNWHHVSDLAHVMQGGGYRPCLTDCAVTVGEKTANAGHSIAAIFAAFVPLDFFAWARVEGQQEMVPETKDDLEPEYKTVYRVPGFRADAPTISEGFRSVGRCTGTAKIEKPGGGEIEEFQTWDDEQRAADYHWYLTEAFKGREHFAELRVCVQVEAHAVTAYDTVARGRQADEQLYLFAPTRAYVADRRDWLSGKLFAQILKALHLRCKADGNEQGAEGSGVYAYGSNKGGGRTNPAHFPAFALAHLKRLANCDYVREYYGDHGAVAGVDCVSCYVREAL